MAFKPLTVSTPTADKAHVLAEDDAALYEGIFGEDCVLSLGEQFASKTLTNNTIRIMDGVVVVGGHVGRIIKGDYEDMMIENGMSGQKRNDLIVARFISGGTGGADTYSLAVVKGTPGTTAKDPAIVREDLYAGGKQRDYPLYRVRIENLSVINVDKLFKTNNNLKILDEKKLDKTGDASNTFTTFTQAATRGNLSTGEKLSISMGKIMKFITDVINSGVAFYEVVNNGTTTDKNTLLDGRYGKTLLDLINTKMNKTTIVNNGTTTAAGTILDGRMGRTLTEEDKEIRSLANTANNTANSAKEAASDAKNAADRIGLSLQNNPITIGSAYGVTATAYTNTYMTSVYFNGTNVGDSLQAYSQRNFGVLPLGHRPKTKVQIPVPAIDGLYFTVDTNGTVSMRNEKSTAISFGAAAMHGVITFLK